MTSSPISQIISDLQTGKMVIIFDDNPGRELEGDLVMAAPLITPEAIRFMAHLGGGIICVAMPTSRLDELNVPPMTDKPTDPLGTGWAVSVDAVGTGTGISAIDRATTIKQLSNPQAKPGDFIRPGHIFPLRAKAGGVMERPGHTESSVELVQAAGLFPAAVICEIMLPDGRMARHADTIEFAREHNLNFCQISEIIEYIKTR